MPNQSATFPVMTISPATPSVVVGPDGGPFTPPSVPFSVFNDGTTQVLQWSVSCDVAWLDLSESSGSIGPNRSHQVAATPNAAAQSLEAGQHTATLTFLNNSPSVPASQQQGPVQRTIQLTVSGATLHPGAGWGGATSEPGQIGSGTAKCIAHWDVVPHQTIVEAVTPTFTIGVVAFHIAGIEKVSFSVEDGDWVDVTQMSLNPQTGVWEYCATLDLSDFVADGEVEIRAIAYPKAAAPQAEGTGAYPGGGYPRLLESMYLYLDVDTAQTANVAYVSDTYGSDSTGDGTAGNPFKTVWKAAQLLHTNGGGDAGGGIVYVDAGLHTMSEAVGTVTTADRWLTVTAWPGVNPYDCRVTAPWPPIKVSKLRLFNCRVDGQIDGANATGRKAWADHVQCVGAGIQVPRGGDWFSAWDGGFFLTDVEISDDERGISNPTLGRNVTTTRVQKGAYGFGACIINWHLSDTHPYNGGHTTVVGLNIGCLPSGVCPSNSIYYNVIGENLDSGHFLYKSTASISDIAFVNVSLQGAVVQGTGWGEGCGPTNHLLLWNVTHRDGGWTWDQPQSALSNISIRGSIIRSMGFRTGGNSVAGNWFDHCHYVDTAGGLGITPGTNITTGDPRLDATFHPLPDSPLINRVPYALAPADADGVVRTVPTSVGAYE